MTMTHMYCPSCGYMHDQPGVGVPKCPKCESRLHWVSGTEEELTDFRDAISSDPCAWRSFFSSDYWLKHSCAQPMIVDDPLNDGARRNIIGNHSRLIIMDDPLNDEARPDDAERLRAWYERPLPRQP